MTKVIATALQPTKSKKKYDAARTKEIILDAAEELFAEQGYSAARIDAIAKASGYNKSLIYQYFHDKLGLYTEVVKRADQLGDRMLAGMLGGLLEDESLTKDPDKFETFLVTLVKSGLQFLFDHPRFLKIFAWEAAEEWQTWNQITYRPDDITPFIEIAKKARQNGILRPDLDPLYFPIILMHNVFLFTVSLKRFKPVVAAELDETEALEHSKEQIASFVVRGLMAPSHLT